MLESAKQPTKVSNGTVAFERERVICGFREFDFRGDGEKIFPYHSPAWLNRSWCVSIDPGGIHIPIYLLPGGGEGDTW